MAVPEKEISSKDIRASERTHIQYSSTHVKHMPSGSITDFEWKDYCPSVFRIVQEFENIDHEEYIGSVCGDEILRKVTSGKPGILFLLSKDDRFIIKILRKSEIKVILEMLPNYYRHLRRCRCTLMPKIYGAHCVKPVGGLKVYFAVLSNIFQSDIMMHRVYDLKGSWKGRTTKKVKVREKTILKDSDFDFCFYIDPLTRHRLLSQIKLDCEFLASEGIMDYSLLLGMHVKGSHKGLFEGSSRFSSASAYRDSDESISSSGTSRASLDSPDNSSVSSLTQWSTPSRVSIDIGSSISSFTISPASTEGRSSFSCHGSSHETKDSNVELTFGNIWSHTNSPGTKFSLNMPARAVKVQRNETGSASVACSKVGPQDYYEVVLYFQIVDTFQNYGARKRSEHAYKSVQHDSKSILAVHPKVYSSRFQEFIRQIFQADE